MACKIANMTHSLALHAEPRNLKDIEITKEKQKKCFLARLLFNNIVDYTKHVAYRLCRFVLS